MKRIKLYALLGAFLLLSSSILVSCDEGKENDKGSTTNESLITEEEESKETIKPESNNTSNLEENKPSDKPVENIAPNTLKSDKSISSSENSINKIKYPVFNNIKNDEKINKLTQDYAKKLSDIYNSSDSNSLEANYKVMYQSDKFISIQFLGNVSAETAAYPSKFQSTLNIDIEKASLVKLNEIVDIDQSFINKFKEGLISSCNSLGVNASDIFNLDNLEELLSRSDNIGEYLPETQSYFTNNQLSIILTVPHALGDYIEVTLK